MLPRPRFQPSSTRACPLQTTRRLQPQCRRYAAAATAAAIAPSTYIPPPPSSQMPPHPDHHQAQTIRRYPSTQPPSHKPPAARKTQLLRQYTSLLRSAPLLLFFQHNNLRAVEWAAIRRELSIALAKVPDNTPSDAASPPSNVDNGIKLQVIQTGLFEVALRLVEHFDSTSSAAPHSSTTSIALTAPRTTLSTEALHISRGGQHRKNSRSKKTSLSPLMSGPLAILSFPALTPAHLAAALKILTPTPAGGAFPAPRRREQPGVYEPAVQQGLAKLMLLGARAEGRPMDGDGVKWIGGIQGGLDGLRAQLVALLQGVGAQLTSVLEGQSRSLYLTLEGRKGMLEEEMKEEPKA